MSGRNIAAVTALTPSQEGILFHVIRDGARGAYHSQFCARIDDALDPVRWQQAFEAVVARHDALRALFTWEDRDKPLQIIRERVELPWQVLDWRALDHAQQDQALDEWLVRDRDLSFTLDRAPLVRGALMQLSDARYRFVLSFHHLIMDGWSMRLAFNEACALYANENALPASAPSVTRYVEWLAKRDAGDDAEFWRQQLGDFETPVFPDVALSSPADPSQTHVLERRTLEPETLAQLKELARELRVTMSSLVSAAYAVLLRLYCDQDDLVFGTTVAGRPPQLSDVEQTVGLFINTLPLRVRADGSATVAEFVQATHQQQVTLRAREQSSAAQAQAHSGVAAGTAQFESILVYENFPASTPSPGGPSYTIDRFVEFSHFPLAVLAVPGEVFELIAISDPARLDRPALNDLIDNLCHILNSLPSARAQRLDAFDALAPAQRDRVVRQYNDTAKPLEHPASAWAQAMQHAQTQPNSLALRDAQREVTYAAFAKQVAATAAQLAAAGVGRDDVVLVMGPRDAVTVIGLFGALGLGAAFCAVAEDTAPERLAALIGELARDGRRVYALATDPARANLPANVRSVTLAWHEHTDAPLPTGPALEQAAYVMFTSGSTGTPKGVVVLHQSLAHSLHARDEYYAQAPTAFALLSTLPTDSAMAGLFWTLCRGGTLILPRDRAEQDIGGLLETMDQAQVSHLLTVPSLYAVLLEHLSPANGSDRSGDAAPGVDGMGALTTAIVAGEACPTSLVTAHHARLPDVELHNEYGPTEATVWCSAARLRAEAPVRIGAPLVNTQLYVVNRRGQPLPCGAPGELYIGGAHVAARYAGDATRTAERFVPDPFTAGQRVYRSGDRARWHADGTLSFVGRVDDQIKVRGFRVEPGEIEAALRQHPQVDDAVVLLHGNGDGPARLVAWLLTGAAPEPSDVRAQIATALPAHMLPQHYEPIEAWPRTPAGKIDRRALAARPLTQPATQSTDQAPPQDPTQATLAAIWCEVLGVEQVSINDDFFALGGDSLLSIRVLARAGKTGLALTSADFFANPTVAGQAAAAKRSPKRKISQKPVVGPLPLMPIQHWFFAAIDRGTAHWNLSYRFDLATPTTLAKLRRAVTAVVTHHDALRSAFTPAQDGWQARLLAPADVEHIDELDLRAVDDARSALREHADRINQSLRLDQPPLMHITLVRTPDAQADALIIAAHHLVLDAESWRIVVEDLSHALDQVDGNLAPNLPAKTDALRTWASRLQDWAQSDAFEATAQRWRDALAGPYAELDADTPVAPERNCEQFAQTLDVLLDAATTSALAEAAQQHRASVYELLVSAVARAVGLTVGQPAVRFELEGHGRDPVFEDVDVSRTVGWFTAAFPLVVREPAGFTDAAAALRAVKTALRALPDNGVSYGALVAHAAPKATELVAAGRASVLFNYLGSDEHDDGARLVLRDTRCGQARADDAPRPYLLEINALIRDGQLVLSLTWPTDAFAQSRLQVLADTVFDTLRTLCGSGDDTAVPEDFPLANLSAENLSDLSDLLEELDDELDDD